MGKKIIEQGSNACHIRLSEYYLRFYQVKYGGHPIAFPENHPLRMTVNTQLCQNASLKLLTPHCYCDLAFNYDRDGVVFDLNIATPSPDEKDQFLAVSIPDTVYRYGVSVKTSANWQLSKSGTETFRKQAKEEFWSDCLTFIRECKARAASMGEDVTIESALSDFMIHYDIPMEHFENMVRYHNRVRTRMIPQIEKKRECMEDKSGRLFYYT